MSSIGIQDSDLARGCGIGMTSLADAPFRCARGHELRRLRSLTLDSLTLGCSTHVPATVRPEINKVGEARALRNSRSDPTISM